MKKKTKKATNEKTLGNLNPKNYFEQLEIFFASECTVNPVFEYEDIKLTQKTRENFAQVSFTHFELAKSILDIVLNKFGSENKWLESFGEVLSQEEVETIFNDYIREHGFEEDLELNLTPNIASTASTVYDPKTGKNVLNVKVPCNYRKDWILGVADHEVATHFLRRHNEKHQFFCRKKEKYEIKSCLKTEEGLASLNQLIRTVRYHRLSSGFKNGLRCGKLH